MNQIRWVLVAGAFFFWLPAMTFGQEVVDEQASALLEPLATADGLGFDLAQQTSLLQQVVSLNELAKQLADIDPAVLVALLDTGKTPEERLRGALLLWYVDQGHVAPDEDAGVAGEDLVPDEDVPVAAAPSAAPFLLSEQHLLFVEVPSINSPGMVVFLANGETSGAPVGGSFRLNEKQYDVRDIRYIGGVQIAVTVALNGIESVYIYKTPALTTH